MLPFTTAISIQSAILKVVCGSDSNTPVRVQTTFTTAQTNGLPPSRDRQSIRFIMTKFFVLTIAAAGIFATSLYSAEPKDDVQKAAKKLGEKSNYSWMATAKNEGESTTPAPGPVEGQTEKEGFTYVSFSIGNNDIEMAFKGDKAAIKRQDEWQGTDELEGNDAWIATRLKAFKAPVAEAEDMAGKIENLKKGDENIYSGDLTESGAKDLISRARRRGGDGPDGAKGWAKFWIKDGVLSKYQYNVQGKITAGQREVEINRTTTVEIKNAGSTTVKIPSAAKNKLEKAG
jgi:hypothetical protein